MFGCTTPPPTRDPGTANCRIPAATDLVRGGPTMRSYQYGTAQVLIMSRKVLPGTLDRGEPPIVAEPLAGAFAAHELTANPPWHRRQATPRGSPVMEGTLPRPITAANHGPDHCRTRHVRASSFVSLRASLPVAELPFQPRCHAVLLRSPRVPGQNTRFRDFPCDPAKPVTTCFGRPLFQAASRCGSMTFRLSQHS
jgi:hypothetical protein